ncbi:MAG TPA: VOC family protein [Gemmatimonadales bacterium]|jgi:predicted enzyme related to lactoylglutathione lyase|nr:VOC family protein [Gemmatimonadales bacterium]
MPRPIHFEIPADSPERAIGFYQQVFGWQFQKWEGPMPYWLVKTGANGPGIDGGLLPRGYPGQGTVNTIDVGSCDEFVRKVEKAGGKVSVPKMAIPGVGWLAYCTDPEGNTFGIMQNDPKAA